MADETSKDKPKGNSGKNKSSDKGKQAKKPSSGKPGKPTARSSSKAVASSAADTPMQVDLVWTVAFVVVAFVIGFFVRGLFITEGVVTPANNFSTSVPGSGSELGAGTTAPTLTEDQLYSGQLPAGHPNVGGNEATQSGSGSGSGTSDPSAEILNSLKEKVKKVDSDVPLSGAPGSQSVDVKEPEKKK